MDIMVLHRVGCVVIVNMRKKEVEGSLEKDDGEVKAIGMITKSDILMAYRDQVDIDAPCQQIMGDRRLVSCYPGDDRDQVARILEKNKTHHVIVVDEKHTHFVGIVSTWDVAAECAKDNRAWPYLRSEDGKIPFPEKIEKEDVPPPPPYDPENPPPYDPEKPTTILNHPHEESTTYMDDLDLGAFQ